MFPTKRTQWRRPRIVISAVLFSLTILISGGCHFLACRNSQCIDSASTPEVPTYSVYVSPQFKTNKPKRIVMLAAGQTPGNFNETQKLIQLLASKLRAAGAFEIVTPPNERLPLANDNILKGRFSEREMSELARRYNADAIGLVRVNEFRGYAPMRTSVTMAIVDSAETVVSFAIDGSWDTADGGVNRQFRNYVNAHCQSNPLSSQYPSLQLQSPESLFAFVASQMDQALQSTFY
jgi:hypothetical protein